jgi:hypothetical protein
MSFPEFPLFAAYACQQRSASGAYALRGASRWTTLERLRHFVIDEWIGLDGSSKEGLKSWHRHHFYPADNDSAGVAFSRQTTWLIGIINWCRLWKVFFFFFRLIRKLLFKKKSK